VPKNEAFEALRLANHKLAITCKPISKESEALAKARVEALRKAKAEKKALRAAQVGKA
jgi:hypothetical protein